MNEQRRNYRKLRLFDAIAEFIIGLIFAVFALVAYTFTEMIFFVIIFMALSCAGLGFGIYHAVVESPEEKGSI